MNDYAFLDSKALSLVHGDGIACYEGELSPRRTGAVFHRKKRQDWNPLWLILVESWPAVIWKFSYDSFWKRANTTW